MTSTERQQTESQFEVDRYDPSDLELKWRARWDESGLHKTRDTVEGKPNWYALVMFPYPSGDLHVGHWFQYVGADAHARFKRMEGFNVLHPQGFDAFGLPAENAAILNNINPAEFTRETIENARRQFRLMGTSYDWDREIITCEPEYYKWNQYFFLKFMEKGIAYRADGPVNWCNSCQTTLANEQVKDGACERCGTVIERRNMTQWYFKITDYADELLDMDNIDWPDRIKLMQTNWIGRSEGADFNFDISEYGIEAQHITTFTTRIDTVYGVTFIVLAPEHPLVESLTQPDQAEAVQAYIASAAAASEVERTSTEREKTGVPTGSYAINPLNGDRVPILVGDYVLASYGTGAVMGVPAHDERDFVFATKYDLPIRVVVAPDGWDGSDLEEAYLAPGAQVNSGEFDGLNSTEGMQKISDKIEAEGWGHRTISYKMRDWLISRQRYWGTPIPVVYCDDCGTVPVPVDQLPVELPREAQFKPTGRSPLIDDESFVNTTCPRCGKPAKRETDTMDTFMDSSWYHLRFTDPHNDDAPFDLERAKNWMPVHRYMGGVEHAVMHLLYSRFFNKALRDLGIVDFDEPYTRLFNQGIMTTEGGKISKRNRPMPADPLVERFGTDTVRTYLMFLGPWGDGGMWSDEGMNGPSRWLNRVWDLANRDPERLGSVPVDNAVDSGILRGGHALSKKAVVDFEAFKFNTVIAGLMEYTNELAKAWDAGGVSPATWSEAIERTLLILAPIAPHITEELWERTGHEFSIHSQSLPSWKEDLTMAETVTIVVQINGKLRARLEMPADSTEDQVAAVAMAESNVQAHTEGKQIRKQIYVPNKLLNLVVG
ncbi:MAG: leucine--tRNA ligase [Chloroflexi bacterium]|nr:leucine--tRNA ligase [Chloroflexota bacterium]